MVRILLIGAKIQSNSRDDLICVVQGPTMNDREIYLNETSRLLRTYQPQPAKSIFP